MVLCSGSEILSVHFAYFTYILDINLPTYTTRTQSREYARDYQYIPDDDMVVEIDCRLLG